jgi:hypothetical protein
MDIFQAYYTSKKGWFEGLPDYNSPQTLVLIFGESSLLNHTKTFFSRSMKNIQIKLDLPRSGLLYPLMIWSGNTEETVIRSIMSVDEVDQSISFAGDILNVIQLN